MSIVFSVVGLTQTAQQATAWGLPSWVWLLSGYIVFSASAFSVIYGLWKENKSLREKPKIELLYDEKLKPCKEDRVLAGVNDFVSTTTVYRLGVRVLGLIPVEDIEVFPLSLRKITEDGLSDRQLSSPLPLKPMRTSDKPQFAVNAGQTPTDFVNVLEHPNKSNSIRICYHSGYKPVVLEVGRYVYLLAVRGKNASESMLQLTISLNDYGDLSVADKRVSKKEKSK